MSEIKILKAKLIKGGESLETVEKKSGAVQSNGKEEYHNAVHPDLIKAFNGLAPHLAILSGIVKEKQVRDKDLMEKFSVSSYSRGKDETGVVITGRYTGPFGGVTINTPFLSLSEESEQPYALLGDLVIQLDKAEAEVLEYIGGKTAQLAMDFNTDEPITGALIAEPVGQTTIGNKLPKADPAAMQRVQEWSPEDYNKEVDATAAKGKVGKGGKKRVAQTADAKSGQIPE